MSFLSAGSIAIAAGLTIPPLIAMYFLKLKRSVRVVPSTFLWKRSVEDLQVNSPFQRLRSSLLLLLQLLILLAAAVALGKPMIKAVTKHSGTVILLIDNSASMNVVEADGRTRLSIALEQAKLCVDNLDDDARAMVIEFSDRASVVSSFDTDKHALKRKIDTIKRTQSASSLEEAMSLAEAYTQNIIIGSAEAGSDNAPESTAPKATVFLFTDGRIERADTVALQKFETERIRMTLIGERGDNVGIIAMDARRSYERPEMLEVAATVRNFGTQPLTFDATLYIDGQNVDVQSIELASGVRDANVAGSASALAPEGSTRVIAFDEIEFAGSGVVEVSLRVDDALNVDDRAWTVIAAPRHVRILLVGEGNLFLESAIATLDLDVVTMSGEEYENAEDDELTDGARSIFDVVIFDRHDTDRLPQGNYMFWGSVPNIDGVSSGRTIDNEIIFNWDETHPVLRHVGIETLYVYEWLRLTVPPEAKRLIDGESSAVLAYLTRDASQFLICAFPLIIQNASGESMMNSYWVTSVDFVVFIQNMVQYLSSNVTTTGTKSVRPGQPVTLPVPKKHGAMRIHRPNGESDPVHPVGGQSIHYPRTRFVGPYRLEPGVPGRDVFTVNLFNATESNVAPADTLTLGAETVNANAGSVEANQPAWPYFLLATLALMLLEWVVYNRRVFV